MSLTKAHFQAQMRRISETFGADNFPRPRTEEIWKVVHELPDKEFTKIISRLVGEQPIKYPPTVIQFREFAETKLKELRTSGVKKQDWEKVMDELAERKKLIAEMTPEQREELVQKRREMAKKIIKPI